MELLEWRGIVLAREAPGAVIESKLLTSGSPHCQPVPGQDGMNRNHHPTKIGSHDVEIKPGRASRISNDPGLSDLSPGWKLPS